MEVVPSAIEIEAREKLLCYEKSNSLPEAAEDATPDPAGAAATVWLVGK